MKIGCINKISLIAMSFLLKSFFCDIFALSTNRYQRQPHSIQYEMGAADNINIDKKQGMKRKRSWWNLRALSIFGPVSRFLLAHIGAKDSREVLYHS